MARQRTNKTASKRIKVTNPKGNRKPKVLFKRSGKHHLKTKQSRRTKRRKSNIGVVANANAKKVVKIVRNI